MKKLISALLAMALMLALSPPGHADYDPKVDYLSIMLHAAEVGDIEAGRAAAICRNEQIDIELTGETKLDFDELFLLAKIICAEAGQPTARRRLAHVRRRGRAQPRRITGVSGQHP